MGQEIVIGMDGGGSHTRAIAVALSGETLAYIEEAGANPFHNAQAKDNIENAIKHVLKAADRSVEDVAHLAAGLAGIDRKEDYLWAYDFVELPGLKGKCTVDNDALIAQMGAFSGKSGIVSISGTGSVTYGVNELGHALCNYDFLHYASSAARFLSIEMVHRIIGGQFGTEDLALVQKVLEFWQVKDRHELSILSSKWLGENHRACNKKLGHMAPLVTQAALEGSPLAVDICRRAAYAVATGIYLVGSSCQASDVGVSLIGSVITSPYMKLAVQNELSKNLNLEKRYHFQEPDGSPIMGAVLLAFQKLGKNFIIPKETP